MFSLAAWKKASLAATRAVAAATGRAGASVESAHAP
jgi:hypothetical protein